MSSTLSRACSTCTQLILFPIRCVYSTWIFPVKVVYGLYTNVFTSAPSQPPTEPEPILCSNVAPPAECPTPVAYSFTKPIRRNVLKRNISAKAKFERALAHEDSPAFVSLLNLALRRYITELSRLSLKELFEEFQINFYLDPPPNLKSSPRTYLDSIGWSKSSLLRYRTVMLAQMSSHALGLCHISPQDAYRFRQPKLSEGFSAKKSLRLVLKKLEFLNSRSQADSEGLPL